MNSPLVTVIVVTYNAADTLENCINSIVSQAFDPYELLIIDGASEDNTLAIVQSFSKVHPGIRCISEKDQGIYDAMNKGTRLAKGEWLYFLGSDDKLYNAGVLEIFSQHLKNDTDLVYGNSIWFPENKTEEGEWTHRKLLNQSINHQRIFYRKNLFERFGYYNTSYVMAADYERNITFFCEKSIRKKFINQTVAWYHSGGFTANKIDEKFWNDWEKIMHTNFKPWLPRKKIYGRLEWYCWYHLRKKKYRKGLAIFTKIYFHTYSYAFLKHTLSQILKAIKE